MLQKLNQKDKFGKELYQEVLLGDKTTNHKKIYGTVGTLKELNVNAIASQRQAKRHPEPLINKIHSNKKTTLGRRIYYQIIKFGGGGSTSIKQIQETYSAIKRKTAVLEFIGNCESKKKQWEERMIEKLKLFKTI